MPRSHDRGGWPGAGPIDRTEHELSMWEKNLHGLMGALGSRASLWTGEESRRAIEDIDPEQYEKHTYYERWTIGLETLLIQKGVLTREEIDQKVAELGL